MNANEIAIWLFIALLAFLVGQGRINLRPAQIFDTAVDDQFATWHQDDLQILRLYRRHTMQRLITCYNMDELRTLAFDIGLQHEQIAGDTLNTYAMELLEYCERRGMLQYLLAGMR